MTERRLSTRSETVDRDHSAALRHRHATASTITERRDRRPHSREEAEERYVAVRDEWTAAMRLASSGKPADLAALAIAQEAYEGALAERERWASSPQVAIPVEPDRPEGINAVVAQELSWRRVHEQELDKPKGLRRLIRRITGR